MPRSRPATAGITLLPPVTGLSADATAEQIAEVANTG
jgi:hypothetical protein